MDPLSQLSDEDLFAFFRRKKNVMSDMKGLDFFINQLRDDDLLPTEQHEILMKKKAKQRHVYTFLCSLEEQRPQCIRTFWRCVFQEHMLNKYPPLMALKASLQDGSFKSHKENHTAIKQRNETTKTARKRKNSSDETEQMNHDTSFCLPSSQNTPAKQPKTCDNQHEMNPSISTIETSMGNKVEINIKMITELSQPQPEETSQEAKKCFLREHQSFVNELLEIQKTITTQKKNVKTTTGKKKNMKEKPDESLRTKSMPEYQPLMNGLNKQQEKQKKTPKREKKNVKTSTKKKKIKKEKPAESPKGILPENQSFVNGPVKEQEKQKKTPAEKKKNPTKTSTEKKKIKKQKPAKSPTTSFLSKFHLHVNKIEKEKRKKKKTAIEKIKNKNLKKSAKKKKLTKLKSSQILPPGPGPVRLKCSLKQEKTTTKINKSAVTSKKSAEEPKQGVKTGPNQTESAFAGENNLNMPTVTLFQSPLYVTCGDKAGVLHPDKLKTQGELSIRAEDRWFTPTGFEKFGGKMNNKNWKQSIRHQNKPLQKFIESGQLQIPPIKKRRADENTKLAKDFNIQ